MQIDEREVHEAVDRQHPHHREVPVPRAGEPAAEGEIGWNRPPLPRIAAERLSAASERRIRVEDAQAAADHDGERDRIHPMRDADYGMMSFLHAVPKKSP